MTWRGSAAVRARSRLGGPSGVKGEWAGFKEIMRAWMGLPHFTRTESGFLRYEERTSVV
jgi:hypothetical protein